MADVNIPFISNNVGNIGVGTDNPMELFHVAGTITASRVSASLFKGDLDGTAYLAISASWASRSLSSSYSSIATNSIFASQSRWAISSSWTSASLTTVTASYSHKAENAVFASQSRWAVSSSWNSSSLTSVTASYSHIAQNSVFASQSRWAISASWASSSLTASYVEGAVPVFTGKTDYYYPNWIGNTLTGTSLINHDTNLDLTFRGPWRIVSGSTGLSTHPELFGSWEPQSGGGWARGIGWVSGSNVQAMIGGFGDASTGVFNYLYFGSGSNIYSDPWMVITNNGDVGINTTIPQSKLHVFGQISASGFGSGTFHGTASYANISNISEISFFSSQSFWSVSSSLSSASLTSVTASYTHKAENAVFASQSRWAISASLSSASLTSITASYTHKAQSAFFTSQSRWATSASYASASSNLTRNTYDISVLFASQSRWATSASWASSSVSASLASTSFNLSKTAYNISVLFASQSVRSISASFASSSLTASYVEGAIPIFTGKTDNYLPKWSSNTLTGTSNLYDDGTNVGIGTDIPLYSLTVKETANSAILGLVVDDASARIPGVYLINNTNVEGTFRLEQSSDLPHSVIIEAGSGESTYTAIRASGSSVLQLMPNGGIVGIGTTLPTSRAILTVASSSRITEGASSTGELQFGLSDTIVGYSESLFRIRTWAGNDEYYEAIRSVGSSRYTILAPTTGSVGIRTSSPQSLLHVFGHISASGFGSGTFHGTASYANKSNISENTLFASQSRWAVSASFASSSITSSYSHKAQSAIFASQSFWAVSASFASRSVSSSYATTASYVENAAPIFIGKTDNYLPKWVSNVLTATSSIYDNGTNVGIANTQPAGLLHVGNSLYLSSSLIIASQYSASDYGSTSQIAFRSGQVNRFLIETNQISAASHNYLLNFRSINAATTDWNTVLTLKGFNESVGIGITDPNSKLHVFGHISASGFGSGSLRGTASYSDRGTVSQTSFYASQSFWAVSSSYASSSFYSLQAASSSFASTSLRTVSASYVSGTFAVETAGITIRSAHSSGSTKYVYYPNVASYVGNGRYSGSLVIVTPIPRTWSDMFRIRIHGYFYGLSKNIDTTIVGYAYSNSVAPGDGLYGDVVNLNMVNNGGDNVQKRIGVTSGINGTVAIAIDNTASINYFTRISIDYENTFGQVLSVNPLVGWSFFNTTASNYGMASSYLLGENVTPDTSSWSIRSFSATSSSYASSSFYSLQTTSASFASSSITSSYSHKAQSAIFASQSFWAVSSSWASSSISTNLSNTASSVYYTNVVVDGSDTVLINGQNSVDITTQVGNLGIAGAGDVDVFAGGIIRLNRISASLGYLNGTAKYSTTASLAITSSYSHKAQSAIFASQSFWAVSASYASRSFWSDTLQGSSSGYFTLRPVNTQISGNAVHSADTRGDDYSPFSRSAGIYFDLKSNATDGLADGGTLHGNITFRPYGSNVDMTGGPPHQLGFTQNGNLWMRTGGIVNSGSWGSWGKFLREGTGSVYNVTTSISRTASLAWTSSWAWTSSYTYISQNTYFSSQSVWAISASFSSRSVSSSWSDLANPYFTGKTDGYYPKWSSNTLTGTSLISDASNELTIRGPWRITSGSTGLTTHSELFGSWEPQSGGGWSRGIGWVSGSNVQAMLGGYGNASTGIFNYLFFGSGSNVYTNPWMVITNGGKIGIGTTAPICELDIGGTLNGDRAVRISAGNSGTTSASLFMGTATREWRMMVNNSVGEYRFHFDYLGSSPYNNVFVMSSNSNVGIRTNPLSTDGVTISGSIKLYGPYAAQGGNLISGIYASWGETYSGFSTILGNNVVPHKTVASTVYKHQSSVESGSYIQINYQRGIGFYAGITGSVNTEISSLNNAFHVMTVHHRGYVGIGTTNPGTVLTVYDPFNNGVGSTPTASVVQSGFVIGGLGTGASLNMGIETAGDLHAWIQSRNRTSLNYYNLALNPYGGNVGIGTTGPVVILSTLSPDGNGPYFDCGSSGGSGTTAININKSGTTYLNIRGDGYVGINASPSTTGQVYINSINSSTAHLSLASGITNAFSSNNYSFMGWWGIYFSSPTFGSTGLYYIQIYQ
jgi:hypothetical protein